MAAELAGAVAQVQALHAIVDRTAFHIAMRGNTSRLSGRVMEPEEAVAAGDA